MVTLRGREGGSKQACERGSKKGGGSKKTRAPGRSTEQVELGGKDDLCIFYADSSFIIIIKEKLFLVLKHFHNFELEEKK